MNSTVIPFRRAVRIRHCALCGGNFEPMAAHHALCNICYWWRCGLSHLAAAGRAFDELRRRGYR
jgi:hypothetical protein